jgi:CubicO group peptidase (beta-lactamase class C family)
MTRPLDFTPGSEHRYSNLGYLILRLAIERAAGQPYEPFVRKQVLKPMGITRMVLERPKPIPEETTRYTVGPNGLKRAPHIPHNWLATPTDLVKFLTALTGARGQPFLSRETYERMLELPPPPIQPTANGKHVGLGWDGVRRTPAGDQFSKNGGKIGVSAWLEHLPNGVDWAFMLNTTPQRGTGKKPTAPRAIIQRIDEAALALREWPATDLFAHSL